MPGESDTCPFGGVPGFSRLPAEQVHVAVHLKAGERHQFGDAFGVPMHRVPIVDQQADTFRAEHLGLRVETPPEKKCYKETLGESFRLAGWHAWNRPSIIFTVFSQCMLVVREAINGGANPAAMVNQHVELEFLMDAASSLHQMIQTNLDDVRRLVGESRKLRYEIRARSAAPLLAISPDSIFQSDWYAWGLTGTLSNLKVEVEHDLEAALEKARGLGWAIKTLAWSGNGRQIADLHAIQAGGAKVCISCPPDRLVERIGVLLT